MTLPRRVLSDTSYLITRRCLGRRFLLRPDAMLNQLFVYCLALGAKKHGVEVHGFSVMSNHYHLVVTDVHGVLPKFMGWLNCELAKRVKRLRRWDEVVWEPNVHYSAVELCGKAEVLDKMAYTVLNPVSAELVHRPEDWPGVLSTLTMVRSGKLEGERPNVLFSERWPSSLTLPLTVPPCFGDRAGYLAALQNLVDRRLGQLHAHWTRQGRRPLGSRAVRKTHVTARPSRRKERSGRNPTFSALSGQMWRRAVKRLREFRAAYRRAYEAWRTGEPDVAFPAGTWWVVRCANAMVAT